MNHFHVGWNMPGYLPEMEPYKCETWEAAKALMIEEMDRIGDGLAYGSDDAEDQEEANSLSCEMEDLNLDSGPEWGAIVRNTSYWISECSETECETEEDEQWI